MKHRHLIIKTKGGMGNRMLCTVTGLMYAKITGRTVSVDWRDQVYADAGINAFPLFFASPTSPEIHLKNESNSVVPVIWNGNLNKSISQMIKLKHPNKHSSIFIHKKYSIDPSQISYPEDILVYWSYTERINRMRNLFPAHFPHYVKKNKCHILKEALTSMLPLQDNIKKLIEERKTALWEDKVIGVHVRFTDRKVNLKLYDTPIRRILKKMPRAQIFLATDNTDIIAYFKKNYRKVIYTEKWFPENCGSLHQNTSCPDKTQNGIEALIDMYLLAECDALIYPEHSTFSWISSILSNASPSDIIDVTKYDIKIRLKRFVRACCE